MTEQINAVISEKIRPILAQHGGDISLVSYEDGIVKVRLLGQCSGCPSAMITTEEVIKKELIEAIPEISDVYVIQETNPELLAFAKKILNHEI